VVRILNFILNKKTSLLMICRCVAMGNQSTPVPHSWDEEPMVAHRTETCHTTSATLIVSSLVKQYVKLENLNM
jgi:hypothetical protein